LDDSVVFSDNVFGDNVDLPTTGLEPETSINYEVGVKVRRNRLTAQAFYFWTEIEGLIDRVSIGSFGGTTYNVRRNLGEARVQGFELAGQYVLSGDWTLYGNLAYQLGENVTDSEPLRRIPPTQGTLGIRWLDPGNRNSLDFYSWLVARQDRLSSGDIADPRIPVGGTPGYVTLGLRAGTSLTENQRLTLWLENLTDTPYRVHGSGVDGRGFSANIGYELRR
jgi:outer membrane receptor protein involved in Fe transport